MADLGSFKRAAERLNTTQPNISSRINGLESLLAVRLMQRDAGSVRLTPAGEQLLDHARRVLHSMDALLDAANSNQLRQGRVRVGVTEMIAHTWLNEFLKEFKQAYPNVLLELSVDLAANLETELASRALDITFQSGPIQSKGLAEQTLGAFPMVWVVKAASPMSDQGAFDWNELKTTPIITHAKNTLAYQQLKSHLSANGVRAAQLVPSSNLMVAVQMVADGYGVGLLLKPVVSEALARGELVVLQHSWVPPELTFYACFEQATATPAVLDAAEMAASLSERLLREQ